MVADASKPFPIVIPSKPAPGTVRAKWTEAGWEVEIAAPDGRDDFSIIDFNKLLRTIEVEGKKYLRTMHLRLALEREEARKAELDHTPTEGELANA